MPHPDIVIVPGAARASAPRWTNETLLGWLRAADATSTWTTSVCTGSLLLAAAGLLNGRRATSHWLALGDLTEFGAEPTGERVVTDGKYVTAAGVSSGIDMGLTLLGRIAGDDHAQTVQLRTEYDPQPPYDAGAPTRPRRTWSRSGGRRAGSSWRRGPGPGPGEGGGTALQERGDPLGGVAARRAPARPSGRPGRCVRPRTPWPPPGSAVSARRGAG